MMEIFPSLKCGLRTLVVALVLGYLGFGILLYLKQASFIYFPSRSLAMTPADLNIEFEEVRLTTGDGLKIEAWYVPAPESEKAVIFFHGNGGNRGGRVELVQAIQELGCSVLIVDYRGYAGSDGRPSEEGTYLDAAAAWGYLVETRGISASNIVVYGRSLGGAVACWLAVERTPAALVLESTFTSIPDMAAKQYPFLPVRLLCRFSYNTLDRIRGLKCPVLVAHGKADETVPYQHGRRIFDAAATPKRFVELSGGHNFCSLEVDTSYRKVFREFLTGRVGPDA